MSDKMMSELPMRLALRVEGDKWNAYVAKRDTMDGAVWIGSIQMRFVNDCERRKQMFIDLMTDSLSEVLRKMYGEKPK